MMDFTTRMLRNDIADDARRAQQTPVVHDDVDDGRCDDGARAAERRTVLARERDTEPARAH